ncbi:glycogen debranching protein GlgX [Mesorhizobium sp. LHD-90]|uniref:glycogen debranching protein GlgX n=1 Tax=Mesorhizobium sp. LHD-90 TaxID=3071414 RepID=UPI0027E02940|nr:glycogen debranching protein GlgX [Mesorhizobium sp. LHD-90]MDQ6435914.1 glycogen debranching protein GlgX [Mesorhizobium sp. LHD-90]
MDVWKPGFPSTHLGAVPRDDRTTFATWSDAGEGMWVSVFDGRGEREVARHEMKRGEGGFWSVSVPGLRAGARYGFRADGPYAPDQGLWFDPDKLLMDPYAVAIDRPYVYDPRLAAKRGAGGDTAPLMPKAVVTALPTPVEPNPPLFSPGGLIYEVQVRAFTKLHPDVPEKLRGTIAALAHPAVIDHLVRLNVSAVELMPVTAWIDERHLGPLGLTNAWGYNPVSFMALDPRIAPGGIQELRETVAALRQAGIGVILDLVFNHTGESDQFGPTLLLRGLDNGTYYRHAPDDPGKLVNDTGTGNTLACDRPVVRDLVLDSLRHFVRHAGVDGFRFDLAPVLGRDAKGFDPEAPLLAALREDPVLKDRVMIAEPWDIGPDGYQLGNFPAQFLEWNDRYRDDIRRFWRRDRGTVGPLATRLAGSSDVFKGTTTRTVNFIAAHDGFSLADLVAYERKHNEANGEMNRDGHNENFSWNNGVEGETTDASILAERRRDLKALLATLFFSRGTIMLTAGDEFGRTQHGNNNAYAQDNEAFWLDWAGRDRELEKYAFELAALRKRLVVLRDCTFLTGTAAGGEFLDVEWLTEAGQPMTEQDWNDPGHSRLTMVLAGEDAARVAVVINGDRHASSITLPARPGFRWAEVLGTAANGQAPLVAPGRTCLCFVEKAE